MSKSEHQFRSVTAVGLAWTAFFVLWTLFILAYAEGNIVVAMKSSAIATSLAAGASLFIWRFTGKNPWPRRLGGRFVLRHAAAAVPFTAYWTVLNPVLEMLLDGASPLGIEWLVPITGWRILGGVWLYLIVAGLSYAVRNNERIQEEAQRAVRAEALAAESRLEALRSQLRPHFLFNALHSINMLIETSPVAAQHATERLAELLRYSVRTRSSDFVSLGEEWDFALGYLDMQQIRFGERLIVEAPLPSDLLTCDVPVFSLQPLVENAVVHALESGTGSGSIRLAAWFVDDAETRLRLEVFDDGPGPSRRSQQHGRSSGTGLRTLADRLDVLYKGEAMFSIAECPDGGTCASMEIPVQ